MYIMVTYKLNVMYVEDNILSLSPIVQNGNSSPREENICVEDSSMVLLYAKNLCDTIISTNTYLRSNNVLEIRDWVLSYIHISSAKYRILSSKT